jgi:hypothetical protein
LEGEVLEGEVLEALRPSRRRREQGLGSEVTPPSGLSGMTRAARRLPIQCTRARARSKHESKGSSIRDYADMLDPERATPSASQVPPAAAAAAAPLLLLLLLLLLHL